jgi:hypothetical protein
VGHALGTLRFAAAALGWKLFLLPETADATIARLLGIDRESDFGGVDREVPELLALVTPAEHPPEKGVGIPDHVAGAVARGDWYGKPNRLGPEHVDWPIIGSVAVATASPGLAMAMDLEGFPSEVEVFGEPVRSGILTAEQAILGRRSAVSMDGKTAISWKTFSHMMGRLMPGGEGGRVPWDSLPWRPHVHLGLWVHRVDGLSPGLYALARDPRKLDTLKRVFRPDGVWQRPTGCPSGLPLYLLSECDARDLAARISCGQDIAADGAFSLGMLADFAGGLEAFGAMFYRNMFWEAGLIGQVLYLEAEEAGVRATGIGCYFDDAAHAALGIQSTDWQSLYHFTVGGPVDDSRLTSLPAYSADSEVGRDFA